MMFNNQCRLINIAICSSISERRAIQKPKIAVIAESGGGGYGPLIYDRPLYETREGDFTREN